MGNDPFAARARSSEETYFRTRDSELVEKLRSVFEVSRTREELKKATGTTNEELIDRLVSLQLKGEVLTAFKLFPLVEIAWADGSFDAAEADAVINASVKLGVKRDGEAAARLREWLHQGPTDAGRRAWDLLASELRKTLSPAELETFRTDILKYANDVAEASGGILNVIFQVSPAEKKIIDRIAKALSH